MTPLDIFKQSYITEEQLADCLNVSVRTLRNWASLRKGPERTKVGRGSVYELEAIKAWLKKKRERAS